MNRHNLALLVLIFCALCGSAWGACANTNLGGGVTCVQDANGSMTSNTSFALTLNGTTAGHEIIVFVGVYYITQTTISVTGTNTYHQKVSASGTGTGAAQIWTAENIAGGNETITITCTGANCGYTVATAAEYSGLATSGSFDQSNLNAGASSTSYTSGSTPATTQANELLVGVVGLLSSSITCTPDTSTVSWSALDRSTGSSQEICTQQAIVTATGAYQANGTLSSAAAAVSIVATFKTSGGGGGPPPPAQWNTGTGGVIYYSGGNVGIGTATPVHPLHVAGAIGAEEVIVSPTGADYVFDSGYRLAPLSEVAAYINEHHHLPEIPSASDMRQNGAGVGEMQSRLLAKIEELTLHMIQAEQRNNRLEQENRELQQRITRLEAQDSQSASH